LGRREAALDAGSGSGAHAFLFSALGFSTVRGLEVCSEAIGCAEKRADRLLARPGAESWARPQFVHGRVETDPPPAAVAQSYDIMSMNPPAFYHPGAIDESSPLECGLYTGRPPADGAESPNPINAFFESLVARCLAPGGIAICTWPGIQARQVTDGTERKLHPAQILVRRLGWRISGLEHADVEYFYRYKSALAYESRPAASFRQTTPNYLEDGKYSNLVETSDLEMGHQPSFKFGILALRRDRESDLFHLIDVDLPR
jgi:SAM-dependent methyltransferase